MASSSCARVDRALGAIALAPVLSVSELLPAAAVVYSVPVAVAAVAAVPSSLQPDSSAVPTGVQATRGGRRAAAQHPAPLPYCVTS